MQQGPFFWKEEQDKSAKWKGSCVSTLIMVVCAITASARLIWENVFSPQIDRSRDGENPLYPAKMWSACWTSSVDKNVPLSHTGAERYQRQPGGAALHKAVQLFAKSSRCIKISQRMFFLQPQTLTVGYEQQQQLSEWGLVALLKSTSAVALLSQTKSCKLSFSL